LFKGAIDMIGLDAAKKLKDAGLEWGGTNTKRGDFYLAEFKDGTSGIYTVGVDGQNLWGETIVFTWLPRLDQLLSEIEGRGYKKYTLEKNKSVTLLLWEWDEELATMDFGNGWMPGVDFCAGSPDEAAAQALLWILEQREG